MAIDLKLLTPDTTVPSGAYLFGADSQAATNPSVYPVTALRQFVDARDYGVTADGSTDDTTALQAAVTAVTSTGGKLLLPAGTIRITAAITIGSGQGWHIIGAGKLRTTISQATSNTPILRLTADNTHSWRIEGVGFSWASQQAGSGSNPNSICVYVDSGNNTTLYNFVLQDVLFDMGFRGLSVNSASSSLAIWGFVIRDSIFGGDLTGAGLYAQCASAVGQPNINLDNVYINANDTTEASIIITAGNGVNLRGVEFNNGNVDSKPLIEMTSCTAVSVVNSRCESTVQTQSGTKTVWSFPDTEVVVVGSEITGPVCSGGGTLRFINAGSAGKLSVYGMNCSGARSDGGTLLAYTADKIDLVANVRLANGWTKNPRAIIGDVEMPSVDVDLLTADATKTRGDASVTLATTDYRTQYFNTTLTANRTCTLPSSGLVDGMEFHIVRWASSPGAFTLQVVDPINGRNHTIASGARGYVRYRAVGSSEWLPVEANTLP